MSRRLGLEINWSDYNCDNRSYLPVTDKRSLSVCSGLEKLQHEVGAVAGVGS